MNRAMRTTLDDTDREAAQAAITRHVDAAGPDDCWLWSGPKDKTRYGRLHYARDGKQRTIAAHRAAYILARGAVPAGQLVCHKCDVRLCCNPAHLFPGTHLDNMADMRGKGRSAKGQRHGARTKPGTVARGSRHWSATFTEIDVARIRLAVLNGSTQAAQASERKVSRQRINDVVAGGHWNHVPRERAELEAFLRTAEAAA